MRMRVASEYVDCVGVEPMQCLRVRFEDEQEWRLLYDEIVGFTFEPGFEYELTVSRVETRDAPADASTVRFELVEVLRKTPA